MEKTKYPKFLFLAIVFIALVQVRCGESIPEDCQEEEVAFTSISIDPTCRFSIVDDKLEDRFLHIESKTELEKAIAFVDSDANGPCKEVSKKLSEIDFKTQSLLIGKKLVQGIPATLISQQVNRDCANQGIVYSAKVKNGNYTAMGTYLFAVTVPKNHGNVRFEIEVIK